MPNPRARSRAKQGKPGRLGKALAVVLLLLITGLGAMLWRLNQPYAGFREAVFVDIPRGAGTERMARQLAGAGVVRSRFDFLAVRALRPTARLQAGEYRFSQPASVGEVFSRISRGDIHYYEVLVREGANIYDIAAAVGRTGVISPAEFLAAAQNPSAVRDLAPGALTMEGFLFPDTYRFPRHTTAAELCRQMHRRFREVWTALQPEAPPGITLLELVTLASLVEKETGVAEERPLVASVIFNRLEREMPLEIDPTVIYAALLENRYRGAIYRSDLAFDHPYNTYRRQGLPPGPIACPGREALQAAMKPANTPYLYFVAKPDSSGSHVFSSSLASHEKAVAEYRRGRQGGQ